MPNEVCIAFSNTDQVEIDQRDIVCYNRYRYTTTRGRLQTVIGRLSADVYTFLNPLENENRIGRQ